MARGRSRRGGYQPPAKPAPASGPGALSQRTDGMPSPEYSGLPYGENQAVNQQASAAPMAATAAPGGSAAPRPAGGRPKFGAEGVFGPTDRPGEPMTAGIDWGPGAGAPPPAMLPDDPDLILRALVSQVGYHPDLLRILNRG